jgi:glycosyltransferase involved in cell wall biosynthesis
VSHPRTALLIPCYNERGRIGTVLTRAAEVRDLVDEIVVVDDGSSDGSLEEVRATGVECTILEHGERRFLGEVIRTFYRHALQHGHEVVAVMAGNGKDDPRDLLQVLRPIFEDRADYVQGSRWHPEGGVSRDLPLHRGLAIRVFTRTISLLYRHPLTDCSNGFRAYRTDLLRDRRVDWTARWQGVSYQVEIYLLLTAIRLGYRVVEVPVHKIYPRDGKAYTKATAVDWWNMVKPIVWCTLGLDRLGAPRRRAEDGT